MEIKQIKIEQIKVDQIPNCRDELGGIEGLMESLSTSGQHTPVGLNTEDGVSFSLVYGFRRLTAAKALGWETITARVYRGLDENKQLELNLMENVARKDLTPIEEARALKRLLSSGSDPEGVRQALGWSKTIFTQRLGLLDMSSQVQEALSTNSISVGQARAITNAPEDRQGSLIKMAQEGATMRALKQEVEALKEVSGNFYVDEPQIPVYEDEPVPVVDERDEVMRQIEDAEMVSGLDAMSLAIKQGLNNLAATTVVCDERLNMVLEAIKQIDFTALSVKDLTNLGEVIEEVSDSSWGAFNSRCPNESSLNHKER